MTDEIFETVRQDPPPRMRVNSWKQRLALPHRDVGVWWLVYVGTYKQAINAIHNLRKRIYVYQEGRMEFQVSKTPDERGALHARFNG